MATTSACSCHINVGDSVANSIECLDTMHLELNSGPGVSRGPGVYQVCLVHLTSLTKFEQASELDPKLIDCFTIQ